MDNRTIVVEGIPRPGDPGYEPDWWDLRPKTEIRMWRRLPSGETQSTVLHTRHDPQEIQRRIVAALAVWTSDLNIIGDTSAYALHIEFAGNAITADISIGAVRVALAV